MPKVDDVAWMSQRHGFMVRQEAACSAFRSGFAPVAIEPDGGGLQGPARSA
jgi:hypothetical protein